MAVIGSLSVKLGLVTVDFDKATDGAKTRAKELQKALNELGGGLQTLNGYWKTLGGGIGVASIGMGALIAKSLEFANTIKDISEGFGISVAKTLQFRDALQTSGVSADKAQKIMSTLFSKIQEAKEGNETTITQFQRMGVSFSDLTKLNPEQAINKVFNSLAKIGNTYERIKAVKDLLGKGGIGLDVTEVAQKLGISTAEYEKHADAIKKVGQVSDNLKTSLDNLTIAFTDLIAPFTRDGVVEIEKFKAILIGLGSYAVITGISSLVGALGALATAWSSLSAIMLASPVATLAALTAALTAYAQTMATTNKKEGYANFTSDEYAMYAGQSSATGANSQGSLRAFTGEGLQKAESNAADTSAKVARPELDAARAKIALQKQSIDLQRQQNEYELKSYQYTDYQNKQMELMFAYKKQMAEFDAKAADIRKQNVGKDDIRDALLKDLALQKQAAEEAYQFKAQKLQEEEARRQDWSAGWEEAYRKFQQDATNAAKVGADMFSSLTNNMMNALDTFVRTGKINFKSLAQSIIQDLIAIQLKAQAMQIFGSGGVLGSLSSLFGLSGGGGATGLASLGSSVFSSPLTGHAVGGSVTGGNASIIGERGPELFIPNQSGTIIPNNQLSNAMGGSTVNYNGPYIANMSAIDTQSAAQFLSKNKSAVWAANQSAGRSVPTSR